jgi:hypothetical protein
LRDVQSKGHTFEIDSSHLKIIAQNPLHRFVASTFAMSQGLPDLGKSSSSVRPASKAAVHFWTARTLMTPSLSLFHLFLSAIWRQGQRLVREIHVPCIPELYLSVLSDEFNTT